MMTMQRKLSSDVVWSTIHVKVYVAMVVLLLSGCQLIKNQQEPLWSYVTRNNSKQTITGITISSLGGSTGCDQLHPGAEANISVMESVDPTWYITVQFTTADGKKHKKSFVRLIPWHLWQDFATSEREVRFVVKENGDVVVELSGTRREEQDKYFREHPEAR